jgi:hypothetical protein
MDVTEYRKRYEAELAAAAGPADGAPAASAPETVSSKALDPHARVEAIRRLRVSEPESAGNIGLLIATLRDKQEVGLVRDAALKALRAASFLGPLFEPHRADYFAALRDTVAEPDCPPDLRTRALEVLAINKDNFVQDLLLRGLQDPGKALVPAAKAIQFLAYDVHAHFAPIVRDIVQKVGDVVTKEEGLRLLASDPGSEGLFKNLLADKGQPASIRALSATGLQLLNPQSFEAAARDILGDRGEQHDLQATVLGALNRIRDSHKAHQDDDLLTRVNELAQKGSQNLRASAQRFLDAARLPK